jgi:hypothetical protein
MEFILLQNAVVNSRAVDGRSGFAGASLWNLASHPARAAFTVNAKSNARA